MARPPRIATWIESKASMDVALGHRGPERRLGKVAGSCTSCSPQESLGRWQPPNTPLDGGGEDPRGPTAARRSASRPKNAPGGRVLPPSALDVGSAEHLEEQPLRLQAPDEHQLAVGRQDLLGARDDPPAPAVLMAITWQPVRCRIEESAMRLPVSAGGTSTRKTSRPSVTIRIRPRRSRFIRLLAPMDAYDMTMSAPARCRVATIRSRVARLMIWMSGRSRRQ